MAFAVEIKNLHYSYPGKMDALKDISLEVSGGEKLGIVGPNGAGKSTLLMHLNGLLPEKILRPQVYIFGKPIHERSLDLIRKEVGFLFQDPNDQFFASNVFEDIAFGPEQLGYSKDELQRKVRQLMDQVGLRGFDKRTPHQLSAGEKRRVCLAGVLACDPQVLVLDEPSAYLDPKGRRELIELLKKISLTQIIASHDLDLVNEICDRVISIEEGRIVASRKLSDNDQPYSHQTTGRLPVLRSEISENHIG